MSELLLLAWVWMVAGGFALYIHSDRLPEKLDLISTLLLVLTWPLWMSTPRRDDAQRNPRVVPVRVETEEQRRRRK